MKRAAGVGTLPRDSKPQNSLASFAYCGPYAPDLQASPRSPRNRTDVSSSAGDRIVVVVQKQRNFGSESGGGAAVSVSAANKVRRGDVRHAVVVRTAKKHQRPDGSVVKFDDNACVLINKSGDPIGSRLTGLCFSELVFQRLLADRWELQVLSARS